jgi:hypothetical protein
VGSGEKGKTRRWEQVMFFENCFRLRMARLRMKEVCTKGYSCVRCGLSLAFDGRFGMVY